MYFSLQVVLFQTSQTVQKTEKWLQSSRVILAQKINVVEVKNTTLEPIISDECGGERRN